MKSETDSSPNSWEEDNNNFCCYEINQKMCERFLLVFNKFKNSFGNATSGDGRFYLSASFEINLIMFNYI